MQQEMAIRVRAMPIEQVVDDPEWQVIRKKMIGNWVRNSEFNISTLRAYLDETTTFGLTGWDSPLHVRRVLNVLVGTVHRVGHTANQPETDRLRLDVRKTWLAMCGEPIPEGLTGAISQWQGTFA